MSSENTKPSYDEWMYWTQVVVDRLTTIAHVYGHPPHEDVFMSDQERQQKMSQALSAYGYLHELTDEYEMSFPGDIVDATEKEEVLIEKLYPAFMEILKHLPEWSQDMQLLLKSAWVRDCATKLAQILFCGPEGRSGEGIGSGMPENGRLPSVLENLLDREASGEGRAARIEKPRKAPTYMRREELARLWGRQNGSFLRSAGRVD
ncbi:MAG: hypothetical protein EOM37_05860 [Proteobacteria bacterium]|jgi:hypothetical protein|nr:hypothetical protein [Alphaproteobacteria bacterium]NCC03554.1 hypothetical protein [Pseudomonadota bacterium]